MSRIVEYTLGWQSHDSGAMQKPDPSLGRPFWTVSGLQLTLTVRVWLRLRDAAFAQARTVTNDCGTCQPLVKDTKPEDTDSET